MKQYTIYTQYPRFKVRIKDSTCSIESLTDPDTDRKTIPFEQIWIGKNDDYEDRAVPDSKKYRGNTILLQKSKNTYYWIGEAIYKFHLKPGETILEFHSPMGNNGVPYPFAWTSHGRWLLFAENITFKQSDVPQSIIQKGYRSPYAMYYESIPRRGFWDKIMHTPAKPSSIPTQPFLL